jgi:PhnB protein
MVGQRAVPMISYEDVATPSSGSRGRSGSANGASVFTDDDGRVTHAELELDGATVMIGWPGSDYHSPAHHAAVCEDAERWLSVPWVVDGVLVTVDDLDAHHARAVTAGAEVLRGPERIPIGRLYTASGHAGHRWMFLQPARDERPADGVIQR